MCPRSPLGRPGPRWNQKEGGDMTQEERKRRSREEIYQVALEEFGTNGYEKVTMERILSLIHISPTKAAMS